MPGPYHGSRKHILDWVNTGREAFAASLTDLLRPSGVTVTASDFRVPQGYAAPGEAKLDQLASEFLAGSIQRILSDWWLVHKRGANVPNWDLLVACSIGSRRGLVLVEAKANEAELKVEGKRLKANASVHSQENHTHIGQAIEQAREALDEIAPGVHISRDSHYQLSNRVAFAWKLASLGVPTVLVYLGFLGDAGIADVGLPFSDETHWQAAIRQYMAGVLPPDFAECPLDCGAAAMQLLIRSRPVIEVSPHRPSRDLKERL